MKITARKIDSDIPIIDIDVIADHPILHEEFVKQIAASFVDEQNRFPDRPVISRKRNMIKGWMIDDFEGFVERIEDFCENRMNLVLTYTNVSPDHSHYYNYLAKDEEGNIVANIRLRLRISNHNAKKSAKQKSNKKQELESDKLHELLTQQQIDDLDTYVLIITVNDEKFASYEDAYDYAKKRIKRAVEVMKR